MSLAEVKDYFKEYGIEERILEFSRSSATVDLAAEAAGVIPARICKTLSFLKNKEDKGAILVCAAGDTKIDNRKFKEQFGTKAKMLTPDEVKEYTGHEIGGVCPFGHMGEDVDIYCDVSLKRFESVFPACGSSNSAIELTPEEMFTYSGSEKWVDVCRLPDQEGIGEKGRQR